jgi:hypothetical protein
MEKIIASSVFSIFNSSATIKVIDEGNGPTLVVCTSSYDNMFFSFKMRTDIKSLKKLGEMFINASKASYSDSGNSSFNAVILGCGD